MPILTTVEPEIEDPDLPYNHEKWDPFYREANNLRTQEWVNKCQVISKVGGGKEKKKHTAIKSQIKHSQYKGLAEDIIKEKLRTACSKKIFR